MGLDNQRRGSGYNIEQKHWYERKDCNPEDIDSGNNPNWALERTKKGRVCKGENHRM